MMSSLRSDVRQATSDSACDSLTLPGAMVPLACCNGGSTECRTALADPGKPNARAAAVVETGGAFALFRRSLFTKLGAMRLWFSVLSHGGGRSPHCDHHGSGRINRQRPAKQTYSPSPLCH